MTEQTHLEFLQNSLIPMLAEMFPNENKGPDPASDTIWFQQDGAPPHYARPISTFLDTCFPERWIGRRGPIEWPARSPDQTPLDYFLNTRSTSTDHKIRRLEKSNS
ncbi:unnamed protein product [Brassicogethes aeneus]|uniref:Transposase n=1 Tax=Brassicogethes aeneus TaxID=1431903 RepID=A0A9P0FCU9_BRAAE|nr:unnamed protein product [Brassicogethes aeneus]